MIVWAGLDLDTGRQDLARLAARLFATLFIVVILCGCGSGGGPKLGERVIPLGQPVPKGGGIYLVGKPYQINGSWYKPREDPHYDRVGSASWYGELFHGRGTANGEIYDMDRLSAAHPTLPLPVYARVTNLNNGRSIVVRINDRGPYARDRIIDLSRRSAELLGFRGRGTATVRVTYLGRAPLNGDDSYERRYLASQSWMHLASKSKSRKTRDGSLDVNTVRGRLPPENPDNLAAVAKQAAPRAKAASPSQSPAAPAPNEAGDSMSPHATTGSITPHIAPKAAPAGPLIQAGSFKNKENADRAREVLSSIAPVDVSEINVGEKIYFRVRVGPFASAPEAKAALTRVTAAGYRGAKVVLP